MILYPTRQRKSRFSGLSVLFAWKIAPPDKENLEFSDLSALFALLIAPPGFEPGSSAVFDILYHQKPK